MDYLILLYLNNFNIKLLLSMLHQYYSFIFLSLFFTYSCNQKTYHKNSKIETEQELIERALKIHKNVLTLDTHADTPLRMIEPGFDMSERHDPNDTGSKVDYPRMKEGDLDAIFFAAFVAQDIRNDNGNSRAKALCIQMIDSILVSIKRNSKIVGLAVNPEDAYSLEKNGKRAIYIGIENGYPIGDDLSNIQIYYDKGVRYITLVHSSNNDLADSATDPYGFEHNGISEFGSKVVSEMNRLGIMVDVSHGSDSLFYDVINLTKAPIIATHSNARAVKNHKRNMTDDMLRVMAKNGGVVQLTMLADYLREATPNIKRDSAIAAIRSNIKPIDKMTDQEKVGLRKRYQEIEAKYPDSPATVKHVVDHIDHIIKVAGIDHVGIGCDFDGGGGIQGVFDASEVMNITIELVKRGYNEEQIGKIWGGNLIRVFKEVQKISEQIKTDTSV